LRSAQTSHLTSSYQSQSDARLRMTEGTRGQGFDSGSLTSNLSRSSSQQPQRVPSPRLQRQAKAKSPSPRPITAKDRMSPLNPFGSPASSANSDENNPFAEKTSNPFGTPQPSPLRTVGGSGEPAASNPFGDGDYDDELNPFA